MAKQSPPRGVTPAVEPQKEATIRRGALSGKERCFDGDWAIEELTPDHWIGVQHARRTLPS